MLVLSASFVVLCISDGLYFSLFLRYLMECIFLDQLLCDSLFSDITSRINWLYSYAMIVGIVSSCDDNWRCKQCKINILFCFRYVALILNLLIVTNSDASG
jgi:hypothetical protein